MSSLYEGPVLPVGRRSISPDATAPDGSEIRLLATSDNGATKSSLVEVTLDAGQVTRPVFHRMVEEVWYVLEGECRFGDRTLAEGDMVYMEDPHFEYEMHTKNGCRILFVQYPGPNTGGRPIYDERFNKSEKPNIEKQDLTQ